MVDADEVLVVDEADAADAYAGATESESATANSAKTAGSRRADRPAHRVFVRLATPPSLICRNAETTGRRLRVRAHRNVGAGQMVEQTDGRTA